MNGMQNRYVRFYFLFSITNYCKGSLPVHLLYSSVHHAGTVIRPSKSNIFLMESTIEMIIMQISQ